MQHDAAVAGVCSTVIVVSGSIRNTCSGMRTGLLKAIDCVSCWCVLFAGEFGWFRSGSVLVLVALQRCARLCIHTIVNVPYSHGAQM